jgi:hypothetical protein
MLRFPNVFIGNLFESALGIAQKMEKTKPISEELIAPCGMNCSICSRYLVFINNLKRSQCIGCRPRNEICKYLFQKCNGINHGAKGNAAFCFECEHYPCKQIIRMDDRYRNNAMLSGWRVHPAERSRSHPTLDYEKSFKKPPG